jgi:hypothetical protein
MTITRLPMLDRSLQMQGRFQPPDCIVQHQEAFTHANSDEKQSTASIKHQQTTQHASWDATYGYNYLDPQHAYKLTHNAPASYKPTPCKPNA